MLETIIDELNTLRRETEIVIKNKDEMETKKIENYLRTLEKIRYEILNKVKLYNKLKTDDFKEIQYIGNSYKADIRKNILRVYIPETLPKYKNISNYAYKNIMLNTADVVKKYAGMFGENLTFCIIIVHEKQKNMDIDNKYVKPIIDALVNTNVIQDDNINNMFYTVIGKNDTQKPFTEVFVMDGRYLIDWIDNLSSKFKNI